MTAVDASVAVAALDVADAHHSAAVETLANATPPLVLHRITAAEVLVRPARAGCADEAWKALLRMGFVLDAHDVDPTQLARIGAVTGLRMPDCCVVAAADNNRTDIATFDAQLRRAWPPGDHT